MTTTKKTSLGSLEKVLRVKKKQVLFFFSRRLVHKKRETKLLLLFRGETAWCVENERTEIWKRKEKKEKRLRVDG